MTVTVPITRPSSAADTDAIEPTHSRDPFVEAAEEVAIAGRAACDAIEAAMVALGVGVRERSAGVPLADIVDDLIRAGGREVRLGAAQAFHDFERAVVEMRSRVVRALVDEDGLSLTDVGLRLQISRQAVARLYREARREGPPDPQDVSDDLLAYLGGTA